MLTVRALPSDGKGRSAPLPLFSPLMEDIFLSCFLALHFPPVMRTFKVYPFRNLQMCDTALLPAVAVLRVTAPHVFVCSWQPGPGQRALPLSLMCIPLALTL